MKLQRQSSRSIYNGELLVWSYDALKLRQAPPTENIDWYDENGVFVATFTGASVLNAIDKRLGKYEPYKETYFLRIDYKHLSEVKPSPILQPANSISTVIGSFFKNLPFRS